MRSRIVWDTPGQDLGQVFSRSAGKMSNLSATAKAGSHDFRFGGGFSHGREEAVFTNLLGNFVMLLFVSKRSGHPAAARVHFPEIGLLQSLQGLQ